MVEQTLHAHVFQTCACLRHDRVARVGGGREKMIVSAVSRHCGFYCVSCIPLRFAVIAFLAFHLWPTGDIQNSFAHHFLVPTVLCCGCHIHAHNVAKIQVTNTDTYYEYNALIIAAYQIRITPLSFFPVSNLDQDNSE